jgi:beta-xylosidase
MKLLSEMSMRVVAFLFVSAFAVTSFSQTSGTNGSHDPSRILECDGKLYVWSTGGGGLVSTDGMLWTAGTRLQFGAWVGNLFPDNQGMWAPDGIFYHGLYWLFYSVCTKVGPGNCGIGLWTTPTLDPMAVNYKLTDRGEVAHSVENDPFSIFDPGPFVDANDNLWLVWGGGGWTTRLDNSTGMVSPENTTTPGNHLLSNEKGEANYIHYRAPFYYFFWNTGGCCNGTASTYTIHMARSKTLTGGYDYTTDHKFYSTNGDIHGPGHIGIASVCGTEVFTYHYYPSDRSILGVNNLTWNSEGWPVAGKQITEPLKPCATTVSIQPRSNSMIDWTTGTQWLSLDGKLISSGGFKSGKVKRSLLSIQFDNRGNYPRLFIDKPELK